MFIVPQHILSALFLGAGIILVLFGIWFVARMYGRHSIEVDAECIDISSETTGYGVFPRTYYLNAKAPVYRYWFRGTAYIGQPLLRSNRPGYRPKLGPCKILINPKHPERVYSSERKHVAGIMIGIGLLYLVLVVVAVWILPM